MMPGQFCVDRKGRTIMLIHFTYGTGRKFVQDDVIQKEYVVACQATEQNLSGIQRSNDPRAVNCPECKKSEKWKMAARANGG